MTPKTLPQVVLQSISSLVPTRLARKSIVAFLAVSSLHARRTRLTDTTLTAVDSWVTFLTA